MQRQPCHVDALEGDFRELQDAFVLPVTGLVGRLVNSEVHGIHGVIPAGPGMHMVHIR